MDIAEALETLDHGNDELWTADGLPKTEVVSQIFGAEVSRKEITEANPQFRRNDLDNVETTEETTEEPIESDETPKPFGSEEEILQNQLRHIEAEINDRSSQRDNIQSQIDALNRQADTIRNKLVVKVNPQNDTEARLAYIRNQNALRAARADKAKQLRDSGFDPKDVNTKSQLDIAMSRKTARGSQRPDRTPKQEE